MTRWLYLSLLPVLFFPSFIFAYEFNQNLGLGSKNVDVLELQKILNKDLDTQVAVSGPGSPGNETYYFGPATLSAVIRFQNLYPEEILAPGGLVYGTGTVGPLTRKKLSSIAVAQVSPGASTTTSLPSTTPLASTVATTTTEILTSEDFVGKVIDVSKRKGVKEKNIEIITAVLEDEIAKGNFNNPDYEFFLNGEVSVDKTNLPEKTGFFGKLFKGIFPFLDFRPSVAEAQAPFGGAILGYIFCTESANYMVFISPLPPSFPALVSYTPGTQGFPYRNLPFARFLLGNYTPGTGACVMPIPLPPYTIVIPTEGTILPLVGSSPL